MQGGSCTQRGLRLAGKRVERVAIREDSQSECSVHERRKEEAARGWRRGWLAKRGSEGGSRALYRQLFERARSRDEVAPAEAVSRGRGHGGGVRYRE